MEGIPAPGVADYERRKEIELGLTNGSISQPPAKRAKIESCPLAEEELRRQLAKQSAHGTQRTRIVRTRRIVVIRCSLRRSADLHKTATSYRRSDGRYTVLPPTHVRFPSRVCHTFYFFIAWFSCMWL